MAGTFEVVDAHTVRLHPLKQITKIGEKQNKGRFMFADASLFSKCRWLVTTTMPLRGNRLRWVQT
jgi:hypothetical protein